jgi:arginine-tRNA-protein transferase
MVHRARQLGLAYVYLGYWIADCAKMSYKANFRPLEVRTANGWEPMSRVQGALSVQGP